MRRPFPASAAGKLLLAGLLLLAAVLARAERTELELLWDDGSAEGGISDLAGRKVAVGFQAPTGFLTLTGMRIYTEDDGLVNPTDPELPTTAPFTMWVWSVAGDGQPGPAANPGYVPFTDFYAYPEESWVDVVLPEPVDLSDSDAFPEGRFYLGIEWEHRENPVIGLDLDPPHAGHTRLWDWATWTLVDTADAMLRAVVVDTSGSPVEAMSWGTVKSQYR